VNVNGLLNMKGECQCEEPNPNLYSFKGTLSVSSGEANQPLERVALDVENVVLRGMSLKNTAYIYGLVIYTGHETKVMMNSAESKYKKSRLDKFTDQAVKYLFIIQILFTILVGIYSYFPYRGLYDASADPKSPCMVAAASKCQEAPECMDIERRLCEQAWYLELEDAPGVMTVVKVACTWLLLFVNLVPISLMISLELVKYFQAMFMQYDAQMYDQEQEVAMRAQASNLNEELGQVEYVFSDKTGTLT
jgi:phospholipid-transporting ATPase